MNHTCDQHMLHSFCTSHWGHQYDQNESIIWSYDVLGIQHSRELMFEWVLDIVLEDMKIGLGYLISVYGLILDRNGEED
jgi:hypothetical protein